MVSVSLQIIPRFRGSVRVRVRTPRRESVMIIDHSRVWVSGSFRIFVLTAEGNVLDGEGYPAGEMFGEYEIMSEGAWQGDCLVCCWRENPKLPPFYRNFVHVMWHTVDQRFHSFTTRDHSNTSKFASFTPEKRAVPTSSCIR